MWTTMQSLGLMSTKTVITQSTLRLQQVAKLHGHITGLIKTKTLCIFLKAKLQKYQPIFMFPWGLGNTYLKFLCFSLFYDWGCLL